MKFIKALLVLCCISTAGFAQIYALNPAADGGFESGANFAANGWTVSNPAAVANNQWTVGSIAGVASGSFCAYITNDAASSYAYTTTTAKTAHFYKDVVVPAGALSISLSFKWKGFGELGADRMLVYTSPTSVTPAFNTPVSPSTVITGATLVWTQPNATTAAYASAVIPLPATLAGTTVRLIFTWQTNATLGTSPGAAVDNIALSYNCTLATPITGLSHFCAGSTDTLSNTTTGGTWSVSPVASASAITLDGTRGVISGSTSVTGSPVTAIVTYTSPAGCIATTPVTIDPLPSAIASVVPVCVGSATTLTDAFPGGTWSSSTTAIATINSVGTVFGVAGGNTIISYANTCGFVTVLLTVNPYPGLIAGHDTLCVGATTTLANSLIGGTWSSSNPAVATILTSSGYVSGMAPGTTYITYSMPGGCNRVKIETVLSLPPAVTGTMQVCPLSSVMLSDPIAGGTWYSADPAVAIVNVSSGIVTGVNADTVHIVYTTAAGCIVYANVTVNPRPAHIVGSIALCAMQPYTLVDADPGGIWSSLTTSIATIDPATGVVAPLFAGNAIIRYTLTSTGCSITDTFSVKAQPVPVISFNSSTNMMYTDAGYAHYQWYHTVLGIVVGATTYHTPGLHNGNYYVTVTDTNGCTGTSANFGYTLSMGVGNVNGEEAVSIYPNPSNNVVYISAVQQVKVVISTIEGKKEMEVDKAQSIDISRLPNGLYTITLYNNEGIMVAVRKLVKQ